MLLLNELRETAARERVWLIGDRAAMREWLLERAGRRSAAYVERKSEFATRCLKLAYSHASAPQFKSLPPYPHWETEPRVPAGNPNGGQWTRLAGGGHHYIPRSLFDNELLSPETRKVFKNSTTGPLRDPRNNLYDKDHRLYNDAVKELFQKFKFDNGIQEGQMTPDQARQFLDSVLTSKDPRIRNFNMRMLLREIMRMPRFRGIE